MSFPRSFAALLYHNFPYFTTIVLKSENEPVSFCKAIVVKTVHIKNYNKKKNAISAFLVVRDVRLELTRSPTRPLNVRVCRFRQSRIAYL